MCHSPEHVILLAGALSSLTLLSPTTLPYERSGGAAGTSVCDAASPALPPTIVLERGLEPLVRWTLENSPTFRQQCRTLAASPALRATVRVAIRPVGSTERALSTVRRRPSGGLDAAIEIRSSDSMAELLAHEIEHVIEQLDGIDLRQLESEGKARRLASGAFETRRAIAMGQRVSGEVLDRSPDRARRAIERAWRFLTRLR